MKAKKFVLLSALFVVPVFSWGYSVSEEMRIYSGTNPCTNNYSKIDNCYNSTYPATPAIWRDLGAPDEWFKTKSELSSYKRNIDLETAVFPTKFGSTGSHMALPSTRTSNDGRLVFSIINGGPGFHVFHPERLNYDVKNKTATTMTQAAPNINQDIHTLVYDNPRNTTFNWNGYGDWGHPEVWHGTLCDSSGTNGSYVPRKCKARFNTSSPLITGDCYDVTVIAAQNQNILQYNGGTSNHWELRSVPVTAFVPNPKHLGATTGAYPQVWTYPRSATYELPAWSPTFQHMEAPAPYNVAKYKDKVGVCYQGGVISKEGSSSAMMKGAVGAKMTAPVPVPAWCQFLYDQKTPAYFHSDDNGDNIMQASEKWSGYLCTGKTPEIPNCMNRNLFELSTTDDGMLLVLNFGGKGIYYSYNTKGACRADGWQKLKPLSYMPVDPNIYTRYDIAKSLRKGGSYLPFRDTKGKEIWPGDNFSGAYNWIDRKGKNLFYAAFNDPRDNYMAQGIWPQPFQEASLVGMNTPDMSPGNGLAVIGAWTQGKVVLLDHHMSISDFGGKVEWRDMGGGNWMPVPYSFKLRLYDQWGLQTIRPKGITSIFSQENVFNFYDAFSPTMPYDVVWKMGANTNINGEVVFDEYVMNQAFVVAHMNSPAKTISGPNIQVPEDGFVPVNAWENVRYGGKPKFGFKENPKIQNAATTHPFFKGGVDKVPGDLRLRGGARVEPVHQGGVIGKGVYLDGLNDFIDTGYENPASNDWTFGLWLDNRELDRNLVRTLFWFPDGSWIGISKNKIQTYNAKVPVYERIKNVDITGLNLWNTNRFHHLTVKVYTTGNQRFLDFYIDGSYVNLRPYGPATTNVVYNFNPGQAAWDQGFQMKIPHMSGWSWFVIGDPGPSFSSSPIMAVARKPFKGWIDEFRVYSLKSEDKKRGTFWDEFVCNLAYGSLVKVKEKDTHPLFSPLKSIATKFNLYYEVGPKIEFASQIRPGGVNVTATVKNVGTAVATDVSPSGGGKNLSVHHGNVEMATLETGKQAIVCEQLRIESHNLPQDFPDQRDYNLCASRTHMREPAVADLKNRCMRKHFLGVANKPLKAGQSRPDFSKVPFCLSCHHSDAPLTGFNTTALIKNTYLQRQDDPRRQPMDWPGLLPGCKPNKLEFGPLANRCDGTLPFKLDYLIDVHGKIEP